MFCLQFYIMVIMVLITYCDQLNTVTHRRNYLFISDHCSYYVDSEITSKKIHMLHSCRLVKNHVCLYFTNRFHVAFFVFAKVDKGQLLSKDERF